MGSPVVSSVPNSQTWPGLLAAEPIETELSAGIGLGEVVHDEPFQLASLVMMRGRLPSGHRDRAGG